MANTVDIHSLLREAARREGVPEDIGISMARAESNFNQKAVSPAGAIGVMQLMPGTAKDLGVDPYDTAQNIAGGMRYLKQQYDRFGSWPLALAAYNAGPGNVRKHGGIPPFKETQNYVQRVMAGAAPTTAPPAAPPQLAARAASAPPQYTRYAPTSDPLYATQQLLSFIAANRAPSLWAQVPPGTMSEAARHSRETEALGRATLAEQIRANKAVEALRAAELAGRTQQTPGNPMSAALGVMKEMYETAAKKVQQGRLESLQQSIRTPTYAPGTKGASTNVPGTEEHVYGGTRLDELGRAVPVWQQAAEIQKDPLEVLQTPIGGVGPDKWMAQEGYPDLPQADHAGRVLLAAETMRNILRSSSSDNGSDLYSWMLRNQVNPYELFDHFSMHVIGMPLPNLLEEIKAVSPDGKNDALVQILEYWKPYDPNAILSIP